MGLHCDWEVHNPLLRSFERFASLSKRKPLFHNCLCHGSCPLCWPSICRCSLDPVLPIQEQCQSVQCLFVPGSHPGAEVEEPLKCYCICHVCASCIHEVKDAQLFSGYCCSVHLVDIDGSDEGLQLAQHIVYCRFPSAISPCHRCQLLCMKASFLAKEQPRAMTGCREACEASLSALTLPACIDLALLTTERRAAQCTTQNTGP